MGGIGAEGRAAGAAAVVAGGVDQLPGPETGVRATAAARVQPPVLGARAELRRQLETQPRLRLATLIAVVVIILGVLPLYLMIRASSQDPVFTSLNGLQLPAWSAAQTSDHSYGSRWCIVDCRFWERELTSQRSADETAKVYRNALSAEGWQPWKVQPCPEGKPGGNYTCWRRDEYTLDLWVRDPPCKSAQQAPAEPAEPGATKPEQCAGSLVSIKVRNRTDDERGRGGEPTEDPKLTGETPDAVFTPDPLLPTAPN